MLKSKTALVLILTLHPEGVRRLVAVVSVPQGRYPPRAGTIPNAPPKIPRKKKLKKVKKSLLL
jgi:hypothetical protein